MRYKGGILAIAGGVLIAFILLIGSENSVKNTDSLVTSTDKQDVPLDNYQIPSVPTFSINTSPRAVTQQLDYFQDEIESMNAARSEEKSSTEQLRAEAEALIARLGSQHTAPQSDNGMPEDQPLSSRLQGLRERLQVSNEEIAQ